MGSLLPGSVLTDKRPLVRKGSFTKDEIEHFWRLRREVEQQHQLRSHDTDISEEEAVVTVDGNPFPPDAPNTLTDEEKKAIAKDWWTKSNHAYLNTPPEAGWKEIKGGTYEAQFEIAKSGLRNETAR